jgi:DNA-binding GntR family transcriptional regulator
MVHLNHFNLHMRIAECARCPELKEAIERNHILVYNWFYDVNAGRELPHRFHAKLIEAVTGGDVRAADDTMREHVSYGLPGILDNIGSHFAREWRLKREA